MVNPLASESYQKSDGARPEKRRRMLVRRRSLVRAQHVVGVARALQTLQLFVQAADDENAVRQERR
jgi:hypothetical protein